MQESLKVDDISEYSIQPKNMDSSDYYDGLLNDLKTGNKSIKELREMFFKQ